MITKKSDSRENKRAIWFNSILRWSLGLLFIVIGLIHLKDDGDWAILIFGLIILITGFLRPIRCIGNNCKN